MIDYLNILLDDNSASYCNYTVESTVSKLIPLDILKDGIKWSMKNNSMVQYIFPNAKLPQEYIDVIESIDNIKIMPATSPYVDYADVIVFDGIDSIVSKNFSPTTATILRTNKKELFEKYSLIQSVIPEVPRLNLVITDVYDFTEKDFELYKSVLEHFVDSVFSCYCNGTNVQLNCLTDRIFLKDMNNCGAGVSNITLAPNGCFYICPAFYQAAKASATVLEDTFAVGDVSNGLCIKNHQLYDKENAILCNMCDSYQCRRCVWLNRKQTLEVNTPGKEQCVISHLERNASMELLKKLHNKGLLLEIEKINNINYLDPFEIIEL
ncbi:MAG: CXXX repeat peptide maturase [Prevotella sp.]|nr:CXXX repeat peptide maturase [Candidatus Prevotella equi]